MLGLKEAFCQIASPPYARRNGEQGTRAMLDVLAQRVSGAQLPLDRRELVVGVSLKADEEQAGVQLARDGVDPVGEGVAAAEDALPVVACRGGQADVCFHRDDRTAVAGARGQVDRVVLVFAVQRGAAGLEASDRVLLVAQCVSVPSLDEHPYTSANQIGAPAKPILWLLRADPHVAVHRLLIVAVQVVRAVLEALQIAQGRLIAGCGGGATEAELGPSED